MIEAINPDARVEAIVGDIVDAEQAARIAGCDFIFLCTDSHASRAVVCQAAYQYLVPVIDMGVSVSTADGAITHVTGRVRSEEHTSELQSLMRNSYAVFCLK